MFTLFGMAVVATHTKSGYPLAVVSSWDMGKNLYMSAAVSHEASILIRQLPAATSFAQQ